MSNKIKDETYSDLAFEVYDDDYLKKGAVIRTKQGKYVVIDSVNNDSGLQAIAVVTIKDYERIQQGKKPENIIFSSRGSEEWKDWTTNFNQLGTNFSIDTVKENSLTTKYVRYAAKGSSYMLQNPVSSYVVKQWGNGTSEKNHQFIEYEKWVNKVVSNQNPSDYSFTGHSLGGALAQFMAVMTDKNATTFAAARSYRILPKYLRDLVDKGYYDDKIKDFRHEFDPVGYVPLGKTIGKRFLVHSNSPRIFLLGHLQKSFLGIFSSSGDVKIMYDPANLQQAGNDFTHSAEQLETLLKRLQQFEEQEGLAIVSLMKSIQQGLNGGCYSELTDSDVSEVLQDVFPYYKSGSPSTYNTDVSIELKTNLRQTSKQYRKVGNAMKQSAAKAIKEDREEANSFKLS